MKVAVGKCARRKWQLGNVQDESGSGKMCNMKVAVEKCKMKVTVGKCAR
jgi:hypothetical protein